MALYTMLCSEANCLKFMEYVFSLLRYDLDAHNEDLLHLKERLKYSVLDDEKEDLKKDIIKLEANRKSILKALKILNSA